MRAQRSILGEGRYRPAVWRGAVPRAWLLAALAVLPAALAGLVTACSPTSGPDPSFQVAITTNTNLRPEYIRVGLSPLVVAAADYSTSTGCPNRPPDLAVSNFLDDTVTLLVNDGTGHFPQANIATLPAGPGGPGVYGPSRLFFANLGNGTCEQDLVVVDATALTISVLLQSGASASASPSPTWGTAQLYEFPSIILQTAAVDVNGDGYLDLVTTLPAAAEVVTLVNQGATAPGRFVPASLPTVMNTPDRFAVLPDLNGDGHPDLAVLSATDLGMHVLTSTSTPGTYTDLGVIVPMGAAPFYIGQGDFNGDHIPDLIVTVNNPSEVWVLTGVSAAGVPAYPYFALWPYTPFALPANAQRVAVGNFIAGNPSGAVIVHPASSTVTTIINNPASVLNFALLPTELNPSDLTVGNFSPGGNLDFAVVETHRRLVYVFQGTGSGAFVGTQLGFPYLITAPAAVKLRGPAQQAQDLVAVASNDSLLVILRNVNP